jgi:hypothetical protein
MSWCLQRMQKLEGKLAMAGQELTDRKIETKVGGRPMCVNQGMWPGVQTRPPCSHLHCPYCVGQLAAALHCTAAF